MPLSSVIGMDLDSKSLVGAPPQDHNSNSLFGSLVCDTKAFISLQKNFLRGEKNRTSYLVFVSIAVRLALECSRCRWFDFERSENIH